MSCTKFKRAVLVVLFCSIITQYVEPARILGVFPMPSISHQVVFRALTAELARRGHDLVILTPDPAFPAGKSPGNITEIDTGETYAKWGKILQDARTENKLKRGVIMDINALLTDETTKTFMELFSYQFKLPEVKKILVDKTQKFDLVIVEAIMNYHLILGHIFNAPVIQISSYYGSSENYDYLGAPAWHPLYYPSTYRLKYRDFNLWEKLNEVYQEWFLLRLTRNNDEIENRMLKADFGPDAPTVAELRKNVHMLLLNANPIIGNNRPVPPNIIFLGGLHLQPVKELPEDLKSYLDRSTRGVIYVSLGTNVSPSKMEPDFLDAFLDAFRALPYDILWKFDGDKLENVPKNVKIQKWFPQRDLLMHPNIKLFVMQGGLQSTDEAIEAAVPLVGIPMLGDQWYNVNKYVELGIGAEVDAFTMTADDLVKAVTDVIGNESYRKNMERLRRMIKDQPSTPLERGVWWVEYVIRHGGLHLKSPAANKSLADYYMLDVLIIVVSSAVIATLALVIVLLKCISLLRGKTVKVKLN